MGHYQVCTPSSYGTQQGLLNCAPCPPPMMEYSEFFKHAYSRNLSHGDVCSIARRCRPGNNIADQNCSLKTTTAISSSGTDYSTFSKISDHSTYTSSHPTESPRDSTTSSTPADTHPHIDSTGCAYSCVLLISIGIFTVVMVIVIVVAANRRKNTCKAICRRQDSDIHNVMATSINVKDGDRMNNGDSHFTGKGRSHSERNDSSNSKESAIPKYTLDFEQEDQYDGNYLKTGICNATFSCENEDSTGMKCVTRL